MMHKLSIVVHVYYPEMWQELADCIRNFDLQSADVFVTIPQGAEASFEGRIRAEFPMADVYRLENRGYDLGPFFFILGKIDLTEYDYVVKLHTKRNRIGFVNYLPLFGGTWRRKLLGFCRTRSRVEKSLFLLESDDSVGMVGHGDLIMSTRDEMDGVLHRREDEAFDFVAGTMFVARASVLQPLKATIRFEDFPVMKGRAFGFAHECERLLGQAVHAQGLRIAANPSRGFIFRVLSSVACGLYRLLKRRPVVVCPQKVPC